MHVVIVSGKGGTGKTTVASNLAYTLSHYQKVFLADCDVEEPNLNIFFPCDTRYREVFIEVPAVSEVLCTRCGACGAFCRFGALAVLKDRVLFFSQLCHACGGCFRVCPSDALQKEKMSVGEIQICQPSEQLMLVTGRLHEGDVRTTAVINAVREEAIHEKLAILDAPPGTACPFIATVDEVDLCILVTESTPFGLHDLSAAVTVLDLMKIRSVVIINRSDGNDKQIETFCNDANLPILMRIPFDFTLLHAQNAGRLISREDTGWFECFSRLGDQIISYTGGME